MKIEQSFLRYCTEERKNFSKEIAELLYEMEVSDRVVIENLLIAYDQMLDKLKEIKDLSNVIDVSGNLKVETNINKILNEPK